MTAATWMELAWAELGQSEVKGALANPRIRSMFADAGHPETTSDEVPWCAAFAGAMLHRAGLPGTGSLMARSYLGWGERLAEPREGCIVVLSRGDNPAEGHVGFLIGTTGSHVSVLGGNQGNRVSVQDFPRDRVLGYRWPATAAAKGAAAAVDAKVEDAVEVPATAGATPRKWWDITAASRTIRGGLWSMFGGIFMFVDETARAVFDGIAEAAKFEPLQAALIAVGANTKALGLGLLCWGVTLVISRRIVNETRP